MGFSRQEYWSGQPFPSPSDLPDPGTELRYPTMQADSLLLSHQGRLLSQFSSVQFSSVAQSCLTLCNPMNHSTPGFPVHHHLLEFTQITSIEPVTPSSHLILCRPLLLLPPIPPSIRVFSSESTLHFSISPSNEHRGLISFRMDWLDRLAVQGTLKSLLQHHGSKHQFFSAQPPSQSNSHIHT